jgi:urease accessory protein
MLRLICAFAVVLTPSLALAHPGHGDGLGLAHGVMHPLSGLDHVLAMVAVGVVAAQLGGRAIWALPLAFIGMMAVGGALGMAGFAIPYVEGGIALSIVALGAAIALNLRLPVVAAAAAVGLFAIFHGHAHGASPTRSASCRRQPCCTPVELASAKRSVGLAQPCRRSRGLPARRRRWPASQCLAARSDQTSAP